MANNIKKFIIYYLPIFIWCLGIYYFSSIPDLKAGTGSIFWEVFIRKAAHVGEYAVLFWLLWRLSYYGLNIIMRDSFLVSLILASSYAASDEWHQQFIPGRSGKKEDILFDILSALLAMSIIIWSKAERRRKWKFSAILAILIAIFGMEYKMMRDGERAVALENNKISQLQKTNAEEEKKIEETLAQNPNSQKPPVALPQNVPPKIKIDVPFTSQAPFANWDAYHEEACEEASIIMVKYYLDNKKLTLDLAEKEIQAIIKHELEKYGTYKDSSAEQMVEISHDFYGIGNMKVVYDFKRDDIKKYLALGKPIIIPAAGRLLGNPNYKAPGPPYHVLVAIGYDGDNIITNDPGTRKGQNYTYNINVFYNAIHDFPGNLDNMEKGRKAMIILE